LLDKSLKDAETACELD
jgi:hypothetical protein